MHTRLFWSFGLPLGHASLLPILTLATLPASVRSMEEHPLTRLYRKAASSLTLLPEKQTDGAYKGGERESQPEVRAVQPQAKALELEKPSAPVEPSN